MKVPENAPQEEKSLREQQSLQRMKNEIEILNLRAQRFETDYKRIDENVCQYLQYQTQSTDIQNQLKQLWTNDCEQEQRVSLDFWKKKEQWFKDSYEGERSNETNRIIILTRRSQGPKDHNTNFSPRNTPPGQRNFGGQNRLNFQNRPQRNNERFRNYDQNCDYREPSGTQYNHYSPKSIDFGQRRKRRPFNQTERNDTRNYNRQVNSYQQNPFSQARNTWEPRRNDEQRLFETGTRF